jgi:putative cell wall-binding protein
MWVFIVGDTGLLDGLALWPMAAPGDVLLYVQRDSIPTAVKTELVRLAPDEIVIVGGPVRVSAAVEIELATYASVSRVAGASRFTTPIEIAKVLYPLNGGD